MDKDNVISVRFPQHCSMDQLADEVAENLLPFFEESTMDHDEVLLALLDSVRRAWLGYARNHPTLTKEDFRKELKDYCRNALGL